MLEDFLEVLSLLLFFLLIALFIIQPEVLQSLQLRLGQVHDLDVLLPVYEQMEQRRDVPFQLLDLHQGVAVLLSEFGDLSGNFSLAVLKFEFAHEFGLLGLRDEPNALLDVPEERLEVQIFLIYDLLVLEHFFHIVVSALFREDGEVLQPLVVLFVVQHRRRRDRRSVVDLDRLEVHLAFTELLHLADGLPPVLLFILDFLLVQRVDQVLRVHGNFDNARALVGLADAERVDHAFGRFLRVLLVRGFLDLVVLGLMALPIFSELLPELISLLDDVRVHLADPDDSELSCRPL
mmetsp:Transcript_8304/g.9414  ORF Transcript_8304/g.9414 Transcript_8304/m.9414 type:complete len:292 (-) Transcript_8304:89-964(-)